MSGVDQPVDPLAREQLAAGAVPLDRAVAAALRDLRRPLTKLGDESLHAVAPALRLRRRFDARLEQGHRPDPYEKPGGAARERACFADGPAGFS